MTLPAVEDERLIQEKLSLPKCLSAPHKKLQEKFLREAVVVDSQTGFIRAAFMNKQPDIDPEMLSIQADVLSWMFRYSYPTRVIGIPNSGLPLAGELTKRFPRATFVSSRKETEAASTAWEDEETFSVYSFTRKTQMTMHTDRIQQGERYLVVDDVIAHGNAGNEFIGAIQERGGIVVGLAVGWDKAFQGGLELIARERYIRVASVVSVAQILPDTSIVLS